ncbi:hypothetical protein GCM10011389_18330 [Pontibacillus salipaludis]|uniref:Uncharacterized protein n=1 Tax=Pontibacillus salipaludis TaxID=1697394 RepID=A0ABQ1Q472_9BACI|nr:hypothetical protein GCM10011389_18330 [Pontibacillus salipaludis]
MRRRVLRAVRISKMTEVGLSHCSQIAYHARPYPPELDKSKCAGGSPRAVRISKMTEVGLPHCSQIAYRARPYPPELDKRNAEARA